MILCGLYAAALVVGLSSVVAIVVNYVKRKEMTGILLESHFRWQIRTFWWALLWSAVGFFSTTMLIGWPILLAAVIWYIYRIVLGFLHLNDNRPIYETER